MLPGALCGKVVPRLGGRLPRPLRQDALASHVCFRARAVDHVIQRSSDAKIAGVKDLKKFIEGRTRTLRNCFAYVLESSLCSTLEIILGPLEYFRTCNRSSNRVDISIIKVE